MNTTNRGTAPLFHWRFLVNYLIKKIGEHRGAPRLYFDVLALALSGFAPGTPYTIQTDPSQRRLTLKAGQLGERIVSEKNRAGKSIPVIDINNRELLSVFAGTTAVRAVLLDGIIHIMWLASELKMNERLERLYAKLAQGQSLAVAGVSFGAGMLSNALHEGLAQADQATELVALNEIDNDLVEQARSNNSVVSNTTVTLAAPMQEVVQDDWLMGRLPKAEICEFGVPCSGASKAGASKRGLAKMEDHPEVGHLVASAIMLLQRFQPAVVVWENVPEYASSGSAGILRSHLRDMGYQVHEAVLDAQDFGCLENRVRWFLIATTRGLALSIEDLAPPLREVKTLGELLDPIGPDDERWRDFAYLRTKETRDAAKGNGFAMQFVTPASTKVPTLRKGYHKGGSTDPLLVHPTNPNLFRLLTAAEHVRIKGFDEALIADCSETTGHQILGQSVAAAPVRAIGKRIGQALKAHLQKMRSDPPTPAQAMGYSLLRATG
jgi:DNA (cytosine-5)-methyltransferase 1